MPWISDSENKPAFHDTLRGVSFHMVSKNGEAPQHIRVVVTYEALAAVSGSEITDLPAALECFEKLRERLEAAANTKLNRIRADIEAFEGIPTFLLMTGEPI
jgi:hypothetical protein